GRGLPPLPQHRLLVAGPLQGAAPAPGEALFRRRPPRGRLPDLLAAERPGARRPGRRLGAAEGAAARPPFGVNLAGTFASEKGIGEAGRATIRSLDAAGVPYVLNNFVDSSSANVDRTHTQFAEDNPYAVNLIHVNADTVPWFVRIKGESYLRDRYNI